MTTLDLTAPAPARASRHLRLDTLVRLRWLAIAGQSVAVAGVHFGLGFLLPFGWCFGVIAISAWLNIALRVRFPLSHRLKDGPATALLAFDIVQLAALLYMTGGLQNPFALLFLAPVLISATALPPQRTLALGLLAAALATLLSRFHLPLPWAGPDRPVLPFYYQLGNWVALVLGLAFTGIYAWRVAKEARDLSDALAATELVLQREQHLSALDGLAAAAAHELGTPLATIALVSKEMEKALGSDPKYGEDVTLLRSQSERCREILKRLTSLSSEGEAHLARLPLTSLVEEVIAPHRDFGISIRLRPGERIGAEPVGRRNPGVIYGLGNLVENAVDFARKSVTVSWSWDEAAVTFTITDDGPGFPPEIIDRIGEPYMSTRQGTEAGGGLGLGLFIAKTLLERSGATLDFRNSSGLGEGAVVQISWPRGVFLNPESAAAIMFDTA